MSLDNNEDFATSPVSRGRLVPHKSAPLIEGYRGFTGCADTHILVCLEERVFGKFFTAGTAVLSYNFTNIDCGS